MTDGTNTITVAGGSTSYVFPARNSGSGYTVSVLTQPTNPSQTCAVSNATGTLAGSNVTNATVSCTTDTYTVGSAAGGLTGYTGSNLQITDGTNTLTLVSGSTSFTFPARASGSAYTITVANQPTGPSQTCTVTNGSGTIAAANITNVSINCVTPAYTVSANVSGYAGTTALVLQNNGGDNLNIIGNGTSTFATAITSGNLYSVTVLTQPTLPTQTCSVVSGSGTMAGSNVTITVNCTTNTYTISGAIAGFSSGTNMTITDGTNSQNIAAGTSSFSFPALNSGTAYTVAVTTQPTTPTQTCTVSNAGGTLTNANVTNVAISCVTATYTVGGTITGLSGDNLYLTDGTNTVGPLMSGTLSYTFPALNSGTAYSVSVTTQPNGAPSNVWQTCTVSNPNGTIAGANVTNANINCTTDTYTVGSSAGGLTGYTGTGLQLTDGANTIALASGSTSFTFPARNSGSNYTVAVVTQPTTPIQTCSVTNGTGTITNSNVTSVTVNCVTPTYTIGGNITGLAGSNMMLTNGTNTIGPITANGAYSFPAVASGTAYTVVVTTQPYGSPNNLWQTCTVSNASGTVAAANVTNVDISCTTNTYTIGSGAGGVTGYTGTNLQLNDGTNTITVAGGSTSYVFPAQISGTAYNVSVLTQPTNPSQTCTVSNAIGTIAGSNVMNVLVNCTTDTYTVGSAAGGLTGYTGSNLQISDGTNTVTLASGATSFTFPARASGSAYTVTVTNQPTSPSQTCSVTNGAGTITTANITNVSISCTTDTHTVSANVSGYAGTTALVLQNNGGDNLSFSANGTSAFATSLASGSAYDVTVLTQPTTPYQTCSVVSGTGTIAGANVTVNVNCVTNTYLVSGTITGFSSGTDLTISDGTNSQNITSGTTSFSFPVLASGTAYTVTVTTQPTSPSQTCSVTNGAGTIAAANVTNVSINCTVDQYTVGSVAGGLTGYAGSGLQITDGTNILSLASGATQFTFPARNSGSAYAVAIVTQPSSPNQTCSVTNPAGTIASTNVTNVSINCTTDQYAVSGTITGLTGSNMMLTDGTNAIGPFNPGDTTFAFPVINSGSAYGVVVTAQPNGAPANVWQTCSVSGGGNGSGAGTITNANVTNVSISCTTNTYTVGGTIIGLAGDNLYLSDGTNSIGPLMSGAAAFTFPSRNSGSAYTVTVTSQPNGAPSNVWQTCALTNPNGTISNANINNVIVTCTTNTYTVGSAAGGLTGYSGSNLQLNDGTNTITVASGATSFTFPAQNSGSGYNVTVTGQPTSPSQTCIVTNAAGTIANANVTSVAVSCTTNTYTIGGTVAGLAGSNMMLTNGTNTIGPISANGAYSFPAVASGTAYTVVVTTQPYGAPNNIWQTCSVTNASGTVTTANINNVDINCTTNQYVVSGTISGYTAASGMIISDGTNSLGPLAIGTNTFSFPTRDSGSVYAVAVTTLPSAPAQSCIVGGGDDSHGAGTLAGVNVTGISIICVDDPAPLPFSAMIPFAPSFFAMSSTQYTIGGSISGLTTPFGDGTFVIQNNSGDTLTITSDGSFTFPTAFPAGTLYNVTVVSNPQNPWQTCTVTNGTGTISTANITTVSISCVPEQYAVSSGPGGVTGLNGNLTLSDGTNSTTLGAGDTEYTFSPLDSGSTYGVYVASQPDGQVCAVENSLPSGEIQSADVTGMKVNCVDGYSVGGRVQKIPSAPLNIPLYQGDVAIMAGGGTSGSTDGNGVSAQFSTPSGVTTDGTNLYIADSGSNKIRKVSLASPYTVSTIAGSGVATTVNGIGTSASFNNPAGIATDGTNIYISEADGHTIRRIQITTGEVTTLAGSGSSGFADGLNVAAQFNSPAGLTIDVNNDSLYVADKGNNRIRKIRLSTGEVTTLAGDGTSAIFNKPNDVVLVGTTLYVANTNGNNIKKVDVATGDVTTIAGNIAQISGDRDGLGTDARFNQPTYLTSDGYNLFVSDSARNLIRRVKLTTGRVITIAGGGEQSGCGTECNDGKGVVARLNNPGGISTDGRNIYLADSSNHRIRMITDEGLVAYLALNQTNSVAYDYNSENTSVHDGIVNGAGLAVGRHGEVYGSYSFNGIADVSGSDAGLPTGASPRSICAWVNPKTLPTAESQVVRYGVETGIELKQGGGTQYVVFKDNGNSLEVPFELITDEWYHICGTYNGSVANLFVNGNLLGSKNLSFATTLSDLKIGGSFDGRITDVRIYNRVLNYSEVNQFAQDAANPTNTGALGLVAHYTFDSSNANDSGPTANNGNLNGSPTLIADSKGTPNAAYQLNGSGDYITASDAGYPIGNNPRTLCAWIKPDKLPAMGDTEYFMGYGQDTTSNNIQLGLRNNVGIQEVILATNGTTYGVSHTLPIHTWSHVCSNYDGVNSRIYINGSQIGFTSIVNLDTILARANGLNIGKPASKKPRTPSSMLAAIGLSGFKIGSSTTAVEYFAGSIDDIRVYNTALSGEQIRLIGSQLTVGLVAWYDLIDSKDMSGWGNDGTVTGAVNTSDRFGLNGSHKFVRSSSQKISAVDDVLPGEANPRTLCAWVKPSSLPSSDGKTHTIANYGSVAGGQGFGLAVFRDAGTVYKLRFTGGTGTNLDYTTKLSVGKWSHVCATYDSTDVRLYLDGTEVNSGAFSLSTTLSGSSLTIGSTGSSNYFDGNIDDVRVYNRALPLNQIRSLVLQANKKIYLTSASYDGDMGGILGADTICSSDINKPVGVSTYKAMLVDGTNRVACNSGDCSTLGLKENVDWILTPNTTYLRADGTTEIMTTNWSGIYPFGVLVNGISFSGKAWTGLTLTWTTDTNTCLGWTDNSPGNNGIWGAGGITDGASNCSDGSTSNLYCVEQ
ncbi:MAG: DUF1554 domain-containing protein [Leptospiraceae bacterium]|nr:DUF1554 domain-containing protein [Leptospiraceae bacterium]